MRLETNHALRFFFFLSFQGLQLQSALEELSVLYNTTPSLRNVSNITTRWNRNAKRREEIRRSIDRDLTQFSTWSYEKHRKV